MQSSDKQKGFSLVELSIVLVILGLLTGGILTGQSLIRAAELRSVTTEFQTYQTAVMTFKDKYFALPGDMRNATDFWGEAAAGAACKTTQGVGTQTCNGDGDGKIYGLTTGSNESFRAWQHLANAGLIEGTYTGLTGGTNDFSATQDNSPKSKLSNVIWFVWNWRAPAPGSSTFYAGEYGNRLSFGVPAANSEPSGGAVLTPEEAWNIDTKVDDGLPGRGSVWAFNRDACDSSTSETDYDGAYLLSSNSKLCGLIFRNAF